MEHAVSMAEGAGRYLGDGLLHISIANVIIMLVGLALFAAALLLPFPSGSEGTRRRAKPGDKR